MSRTPKPWLILEGGAAGREKHAIQITRRDFSEAAGQFDCWRTGVTAGAKAEFIELLFNRGDNPGMREANLMHVVAVEVEITPAFDIFNPRALRLGQHVKTRRGEGLMEEVATIGFEQSLRRRRNLFGGPGAAPGREVHIAFGAQVIKVVAGGRNSSGVHGRSELVRAGLERLPHRAADPDVR